MTHSNLTRWIEDADARNALLQGEMIYQFQENAPSHCVHLVPAIKSVSSWWHHSVAERLHSHKDEPASIYHH